ncbi:unnamed protein product [Closterium sp. NIES-64]|nr:unnamed protein product [Closterium sp. NIES-64]
MRLLPLLKSPLQEDTILLNHVMAHGSSKWHDLHRSRRLAPHRDAKACCNRFLLLKRKFLRGQAPFAPQPFPATSSPPLLPLPTQLLPVSSIAAPAAAASLMPASSLMTASPISLAVSPVMMPASPPTPAQTPLVTPPESTSPSPSAATQPTTLNEQQQHLISPHSRAASVSGLTGDSHQSYYSSARPSEFRLDAADPAALSCPAPLTLSPTQPSTAHLQQQQQVLQEQEQKQEQEQEHNQNQERQEKQDEEEQQRRETKHNHPQKGGEEEEENKETTQALTQQWHQEKEGEHHDQQQEEVRAVIAQQWQLLEEAMQPPQELTQQTRKRQLHDAEHKALSYRSCAPPRPMVHDEVVEGMVPAVPSPMVYDEATHGVVPVSELIENNTLAMAHEAPAPGGGLQASHSMVPAPAPLVQRSSRQGTRVQLLHMPSMQRLTQELQARGRPQQQRDSPGSSEKAGSLDLVDIDICGLDDEEHETSKQVGEKLDGPSLLNGPLGGSSPLDAPTILQMCTCNEDKESQGKVYRNWWDDLFPEMVDEDLVAVQG